MTRHIGILILALTALLSISPTYAQDTQQAKPAKLFPYPEPPKGMDNLYARSAYMTFHFWDKCNFDNAFKKPEKLDEAIGDWVACMPYASLDTIGLAINNVIDRISKSGPNLQTFAEIVENKVYTDTSDYYAEFIILPFAKAAYGHKKIKGDAKRHFGHIVSRIENSSVGATAHPINLTTAVDSIHPAANINNLGELATDNMLLFFYDPESINCVMDRARLAADPSINALISGGILDIVAIYPHKADKKWADTTVDFPANWLVAASDNAADYFDFETMPSIYYIDKNHKIIARKVETDNIIRAFYILREQMLNQRSATGIDTQTQSK